MTNKNKTTGYKAFNKDWTCREFQYKVGETYTMKEKPKCCNQGFHFCTNIADCFKHYNNDPENTKLALVEALGDIDKEDDDSKCCTNKIKIVKEISFTEAYELGNQGKANTGFYNTGNHNTGDWNTGNCNTGYCNTGDRNTGSYNACNYSAGMFNTKEQPLYLFNKPTDFTRDEFRNIFPNEYDLLFHSLFPLTEWIIESNISAVRSVRNQIFVLTILQQLTNVTRFLKIGLKVRQRMTDKEQIIIDGVDVSKCRYFRPGSALTCSRMYGGACDNKYSNELCYFKQLAHKTRECEELEKENKKIEEDWNSIANRNLDLEMENAKLREELSEIKDEKLDLKNTCYRKALEEIEGLATNLRTRTDYHSEDEVNADIENILDIILEAKGEED